MKWDERIGRRLKLRDLHILLSVAKAGSMGRAAAELGMSQPNVSKAISDMEHALGVRLLDRSERGVEPTLYGRATIKWGVAVFDDLKHWISELDFLADPTVGELRIGVSEPLAMGLLPAVLDRLSHTNPRLSFHVTYTDPATVRYQPLRDRHVELMLGRLVRPASDEDADMDAERLFEDRLFVVAGKNSVWANRRRIELKDLVNERWSLPPPDSLVHPHVVEAFRANGLKPPPASVSTLSIQLHTKLLATGRFLAMLPRAMLEFSSEAQGLKILPVNLSTPTWQIGIVKLRNRTLSPVAQLFIEAARGVAKPLAKRKHPH